MISWPIEKKIYQETLRSLFQINSPEKYIRQVRTENNDLNLKIGAACNVGYSVVVRKWDGRKKTGEAFEK
jgi:hypothetical protein